MKLYYSPGACSLTDHIVLEWIGKPYEAVAVPRDQLKSPEYLRINPAGSVPALETDEGWALTQNSAILHYLGATNPEARLLGDGSARGMAEVDRWLAFVNADVHPSFWPFFGGLALRELFQRADAQLAGRDWIAGDRSIADPYLFVVTRWAKAVGVDLSGFGHLERFFERMLADEGVKRALVAEGLG